MFTEGMVLQNPTLKGLLAMLNHIAEKRPELLDKPVTDKDTSDTPEVDKVKLTLNVIEWNEEGVMIFSE